MDQPGKVANPARGQLNRENNIPLSPYVFVNVCDYKFGNDNVVPKQYCTVSLTVD